MSMFMSLCGKRGSQVEVELIWNQSEMNLLSLGPNQFLIFFILMLFKYSNSKLTPPVRQIANEFYQYGYACSSFVSKA